MVDLRKELRVEITEGYGHVIPAWMIERLVETVIKTITLPKAEGGLGLKIMEEPTMGWPHIVHSWFLGKARYPGAED